MVRNAGWRGSSSRTRAGDSRSQAGKISFLTNGGVLEAVREMQICNNAPDRTPLFGDIEGVGGFVEVPLRR